MQEFAGRTQSDVINRAYIATLRGLSAAAGQLPIARPRRHAAERIRDVPFVDGGARHHLLDVWRPVASTKPRPVVIYVHGGAFQYLSKDSHWAMALTFARRGFVVFNINYRLAPQHPFPAAAQDVCAAAVWVRNNAERFGGDPDTIVVSGESAGGNLATSLTMAACFDRPEPWADRVRQSGIKPRATIAACPVLDVADHRRISASPKYPRFVKDIFREMQEAYLPNDPDGERRASDLASPLKILERGDEPVVPLPPTLAFIGTKDPLIDQCRRLASVMEARGERCALKIYPGEPHAFHAFVLRETARECWRDQFRFLRDVLGDDFPARR